MPRRSEFFGPKSARFDVARVCFESRETVSRVPVFAHFLFERRRHSHVIKNQPITDIRRSSNKQLRTNSMVVNGA